MERLQKCQHLYLCSVPLASHFFFFSFFLPSFSAEVEVIRTLRTWHMPTNGESRQDGMREKRREKERREGTGKGWGRWGGVQQDKREGPCQGWGFAPRVLASLQGKAGEAPSGKWGGNRCKSPELSAPRLRTGTFYEWGRRVSWGGAEKVDAPASAARTGLP